MMSPVSGPATRCPAPRAGNRPPAGPSGPATGSGPTAVRSPVRTGDGRTASGGPTGLARLTGLLGPIGRTGGLISRIRTGGPNGLTW